MRESRVSALVLTLDYAHRASYYNDWKDAFERSSDFSCAVRNIMSAAPSDLSKEIDDFDAVVMLHSCNSDTLEFVERIVEVLAQRRRAKLVSFVGNEFGSPYVSTSRRIQLLRESRVDIVATQLLLEAGNYLYSETGARVISLPHALNPDAFRPSDSDTMRVRDIGVKGYRYPSYLGDNDRNRFIEYFARECGRLGLSADISFDKRLARSAWAKFLQRSWGTISTEVGSWFIRPDDLLMEQIHKYLQAKHKGVTIRNSSPLRRLARRLPMRAKTALWSFLKLGIVKFEVLNDFETSFEELDGLFFQTSERAPVYGKAISSRHFDAIGTQTCQLMLRGRYNDILTADEHYIAIDPEFRNIEDAVRRFKDEGQRRVIVERAYHHVMANHTYTQRVAHVRNALENL